MSLDTGITNTVAKRLDPTPKEPLNKAYLVATGPSLDSFDFTTIEPDALVIAINFAGSIIPRYDMLAILDTRYHDMWRAMYPKGTKIVTLCTISLIKDVFTLIHPGPYPEGCQNKTSAIAISYLGNIGYRTIHGIGFDLMATGSRDHALSLIARGCYEGPTESKAANDVIIANRLALDSYGITLLHPKEGQWIASK